MLFALSFPAQAQQTGKVSRIGVLSGGSAQPVAAFHQGLRELGYVEGQNILIEYRYAEGKYDRLPDLAAELVRLKVDVIFACCPGGLPSVAAKNATTTIPIVFVRMGDAVGPGDVASLARPGGNVSGRAHHYELVVWPLKSPAIWRGFSFARLPQFRAAGSFPPARAAKSLTPKAPLTL